VAGLGEVPGKYKGSDYDSCIVLSDTFVYCAQTAEYIDTISPAYDSHISFPDGAKIWLT